MPSFVALAAIAAFTTATLVLVVTAVARADLQMPSDGAANANWTRWSRSPEISFGDNGALDPDFAALAQAESMPDSWVNSPEQEQLDTTYVALRPAKP